MGCWSCLPPVVLDLKEQQEIAYGKGTDVPAKFASWDEVASLAPLVVKAKREHGCSVASQILEQTVQDICELAETVAARFSPPPRSSRHDGRTRRLSGSSSDSETFTVVLAGGILADEGSEISRQVVPASSLLLVTS